MKLEADIAVRMTDRTAVTELASAGAPPGPTAIKPDCSDEEDDSGCTVHQLGNERGIGALFLAIGLAAFLLGRRRR